jgi:hypothetical protein
MAATRQMACAAVEFDGGGCVMSVFKFFLNALKILDSILSVML